MLVNINTPRNCGSLREDFLGLSTGLSCVELFHINSFLVTAMAPQHRLQFDRNREVIVASMDVTQVWVTSFFR